MTQIIDEVKCARCGVCMPECPHQAIFQTEDAYVIDSNLCNDCSDYYGRPLCAEVCPSDGIHKVKDGLFKKCLDFF
jgi:ferredoxin